MSSVVLFGGTGFIGTHLAQDILSTGSAKTIFLVDIKRPRDEAYAEQLQMALRTGRVVYIEHDVRKPIPVSLLPNSVDLVFNLAAVHREPGHRANEYFETNLLGAENVCGWADQVGCKTMVFTSSISPYGPSEEKKTEKSLPVPQTAYGSSKLAAEKIHMVWQAGASGRQLLVLRPGVVFGPGEGGNVTRLAQSLMKGYFVYLGNRKTIKAAGYVKELCHVARFGLDTLRSNGESVLILNFTMDPPPTMEDMVQAILKAGGKQRRPLNVPRSVLLGMSYPLAGLERVLGRKFSINPVRVRKLFRSNNVWPEQLRSLGYEYAYTLESALSDWIQESPKDFYGRSLPAVVSLSPRKEHRWLAITEQSRDALVSKER